MDNKSLLLGVALLGAGYSVGQVIPVSATAQAAQAVEVSYTIQFTPTPAHVTGIKAMAAGEVCAAVNARQELAGDLACRANWVKAFGCQVADDNSLVCSAQMKHYQWLTAAKDEDAIAAIKAALPEPVVSEPPKEINSEEPKVP